MYRTCIISNFLKPNTYWLYRNTYQRNTIRHSMVPADNHKTQKSIQQAGKSWIKQDGHVGSCSAFQNGAPPNLSGSHDNWEKIPRVCSMVQ